MIIIELTGLTLLPPAALAQTQSIITVSPSSAIEVVEDDMFAVTLTLTHNGASGGFVNVSTNNGTAQRGSDFGNPSASPALLFGTQVDFHSARKSTITVPIKGDAIQEGRETFQVVLTIISPNLVNLRFPDAGGDGTPDETFTLDVTIVERQESEVSFSDFFPLSEEGDDLNFVVEVDGNGKGKVDYQVVAADSTAEPVANGVGDYTPVSGSLQLDGATDEGRIKTITVQVADDMLIEGTETVVLRLSKATGNLVFPDLDGNKQPDPNLVATGFINDNDGAVSAEVSDVTVTEGGIAQLTVTLSRALRTGESAVFRASALGNQPCSGQNPGALADFDYRPVLHTDFLLTGGEQTATFSILTAPDDLDEADECFTATLVAIRGLSFQPQTGQMSTGGGFVLHPNITITDDDEAPTLSLGPAEVVEPDEGDTATLRYPVTLHGPTARTVTVDYAEDSGSNPGPTATAGSDYTVLTAGTLTFEPGQLSQYVEVEVKGDYDEEPDELVWVRFSAPVNACFQGTGVCASGAVAAPGTIVNNDSNLGIAITLDDDTIPEGDSAVFRAKLSRPIVHDLEINATVSGGTATAGSDYPDIPAGYSFGTNSVIAAGDTEGTISIPFTADSTSGEGLETFTLHLAEVNLVGVNAKEDPVEWKKHFGTDYTAIGSRIKIPTAYIVDGPALSVVPVQEKGTEGAPIDFQVTLTPAASQAVTFTVKSRDGAHGADVLHTAVAGSDYTAPAPQQMTIPAGQTSTSVFTVRTLQDQIDEPDQLFTVVLESVSGAVLDEGEAIGIIRDDDSRPQMSIADAQADEGDSLDFVITLSEASEKPITVHWLTEDDTATTLDRDYRGIERRRSVTFAPGDLTKTITVESIPDNRPEPDEEFRVQLMHAPEAKFADPTAVGAIDDDDGIYVSIADAAPVTEDQDSPPQATFTITMVPAQTTPVTIQWKTVDGLGGNYDAAVSGGQKEDGEKDYTAVPGADIIFAPGETVKQVSTTILDDDSAEIDENFGAVISASDPQITILRPTATATIVDDDAWNIWLDESTPRVIAEGTEPQRTRQNETVLTLNYYRTDVSAEEAGLEDRFKSSFDLLVCFINDPDDPYYHGQYAGTAAPHQSEYQPHGDWPEVDVYFREKGWGNGFNPAQCHVREEAAGFYVKEFGLDTFQVTIPLGITPDSRPEKNETFSLWLQRLWYSPHVGKLDPISRRGPIETFTILDDDSPQASISDLIVDESAGSADLTVSLSMAPTQAQTVGFSIMDGTARVWEDYRPALGTTVTFLSGETTKIISIPIIDNDIYEGPKEFTVSLHDPSDGLNVHPLHETATVTITEDEREGRPRLTIPDRVVDEGEEGTVFFKFDPPLPETNFWYNQIIWYGEMPDSDVAATLSDDYAAIQGNARLPNGFVLALSGDDLVTRTISTVEDTLVEGDEDIGLSVTFNVGTKSPHFDGRIHGQDSGRLSLVTIRDDDPGSLSFSGYSDGSVKENRKWSSPTPTVSGNPIGHVTWTIAGNDATVFVIDPDTGILTLPAQNFEDPTDHDLDNTYEVTVRATDEDGNTDSHAVTVTVTDVHHGTIRVSVNRCCTSNPLNRVYGSPEGIPVVVTLTPQGGSKAPVSVKWATAEDKSGDHPAAATDYTPTVAPQTVTWTAQQIGDPKHLSIPTTEDLKVEENETFLLHLTEGMAGGTEEMEFVFTHAQAGSVSTSGNQAQATITIGNDDQAVVSIGDATADEGDVIAFTIDLGAEPAEPVTVKFNTADDASEDAHPATAGVDYTAVTTAISITIPAGQSSAKVNLQTNQDSIDEEDETFLVVLSEPTGAPLSGDASTATGTIVDDDAAPTDVVLSVSPSSVGEGAGATSVAVTATVAGSTVFAVDKVVKVMVGKSTDSAVSGTDYAAVEGFDITIGAGTSSKKATFDLEPTSDVLDEDDEVLTVHGTSTGLTVSDASVSITDDDDPPVVSVEDAAAVVEGDDPAVTTDMTFNLRLSDASSKEVTVTYSLGGTAEGDDYTEPDPLTAMIPAGSTTGSVVVPVLGDVVVEGDETIIVTLESATNANLPGSVGVVTDPQPPSDSVGDDDFPGPATESATATGIITDDDVAATAVALSVSPSNVGEGAGGTSVTVTATLGGSTTFNVDKTVKVMVGKSTDSAVSGTDYAAVEGYDITVGAGRSSGSGAFVLTPTSDVLDEDDEVLTVSGTSAGLTISDAEVSITDDDGLPVVTVGDATVTEGGKAQFTVSLSVVSGRDVLVGWSTGDDGAEGASQATAGTDYTAVTSARSVTVEAGSTTATVEVQTTADSVVEGDETFVVNLVSPTNATLGDPSSGTGTIEDDDVAATAVALSVSPSNVGEGAGGTSVTVTATLGGSTTFNVDKTVKVMVGKSTDSAVSGTDYAAVEGFDITVGAGRSSGSGAFVLTPTSDVLDEDDEVLTVSGSSAGLTISDAEVSITDDDGLPVVTVGDATVAEGGKAQFTVSLSVVSGRDVLVGWSTGDDGAEGASQATAGTDYTAVTSARSVTVEAGSTTATVEVQTTADSVVEGDETFVVNLVSPTNATLGDPSSGTGTIEDDDVAATAVALSVSPSNVGEGAGGTSVTVTATLGGSTTFNVDKTVKVMVGKSTDSAVSGTDYAAVEGYDITVGAGRSSGSGAFVLTPTSDVLDEDDEVLTVSGSSAGLTISDAEVSITDDDGLPVVTVGDATVAEGGKAQFTVSLSVVSGRDVSVGWSTGDDGAEGASQATAGTDYTAVTSARSVTVEAGSTTATVEVQTTADSVVEGDETFVVNLVSPTNATLGDPSSGTGTIEDDDVAATAVALSVSPSNVGEGAGGTSVTVTATLGGSTTFNVDKTVKVMVGKSTDSAVSGTDYAAVEGFDITVGAGRSSGSGAFVLTPTSDVLDEDDEVLTVSGSSAGLTISDAEVSITDDDGLPSVTVGDATVAEGGKAQFTVSLSVVSGRDVLVGWSTGDDGAEGASQATAGTDYTAVTSARSVTVEAGSTTATVEVQTTADSVVEGDETFVVNLASPVNATLGSSSSGTGTIEDDDVAATAVALSVSPSNVGEGAGGTSVTVTATLGGSTTFNVDKTVKVMVGKSTDSAVSGTDYAAVEGYDITVGAGRSSGSGAFVLTPTSDVLDEDDEVLTVSGSSAGLTISDAEVSITDDDGLPVVTVGDATVAEGGKAQFTVSLSVVSGRDVSVGWSTGDDGAEGASQATAGTDYTAVTSARSVTVEAGSTTATVEVQTTADSVVEGDETFVVNLVSPTNATLGDPSSGTGTIEDDDVAATAVALSVSPSNVGEGAGGTSVTVTATLGGSTTFNVDKTVKVMVGKSTDSAVSGTDYAAVEGFDITVGAGRSSGSGAFVLTPTSDVLDEDDEVLTVSGSSAGLTISDAEVSITDDDGLPSVTVGDATVAEGGKAQFTVSLSVVSGRDVLVGWSTGDDGAEGASQATAGTDYTAVTSARSVTVEAGSTTATVEVQTTADSVVEGDETFVVNLASPVNATLGSSSSGTGTITDDDTAPATAALSVSPTSVGEAAGATSVTVTATLGGSTTFNVDKTVKVMVGKSTDSAVSGTDYAAVEGYDITISAGRSSGSGAFVLTPTSDVLDEDDEVLTVSGSSAGLTISDAEVSITDDDGLPSVTVGDATVAEGGKAQFTVSLSVVSGRDVTVEWTTGDDPSLGAVQATAGADYTAVSSALTATIEAGAISTTIEVETTNDMADEAEETFVVNLASPTNATLGTPSTGTGTITDDDVLPVVTIGDGRVSEGAAASFSVGLNTVSGRDVTVEWTTGDDPSDGANQATADVDYTAVTTAASVTIPVGETFATIKVQTTEDAVTETDETFVVNLASPTNATLGDPSTGTGTIAEGASVNAKLVTKPRSPGDLISVVHEDDEVARTISFTVTLDGTTFGSDKTVRVTVGKNGDSAISGTDYIAVDPFDITIVAGESSGSGSFVLDPVDDALDEPLEILTVHGAAAGLTIEDATVTIIDDDPYPAVTIGDASVTEGGRARFTVTLDAVSGRDVEVEWTTGDDPSDGASQATAGTDYRAVTTAGTVTIRAGNTSSTIEVLTTEDAVVETDETFVVNLASPSKATLGTPSSGTGTITDNDDPPPANPVVTLTLTPQSIAENGGPTGAGRVTASLDKALNQVVTLAVSATAVAPATSADFTLSQNRTLTIAAGSLLSTGTVTITAVDNDADAPDREVTVSAGVTPTSGVTPPSDQTLTITDNEAAPVVSIGDAAAVTEGGKAQFTISLSNPSSRVVTVQWTTGDDLAEGASQATAGTDYTPITAAQTVTFPALVTSATVEVQTTQDPLDEEHETFLVTLQNPTNATLEADPSGKGAISDDDDPPTVSINDAGSVREGNDPGVTTDMSFPVHLSAVSGKPVTVAYTLGGTATVHSDYTPPNPLSVTIPPGEQKMNVAIPVRGDTVKEDDETITVALDSPTNAGLSSVEGETTASGTITDDDIGFYIGSDVVLSVSPVSVGEDSVGETVTVTATVRDGNTFSADKAVRVSVGKAGDSAVAGTDYAVVTAFTVPIEAGDTTGQASFVLTPTDDTLDEDDELVTVHGTASGLRISDAAVAILDNDSSPVVSVGDTSVTEGDQARFTVSLDAVSGRDVEVKWTTGDDPSDGASQATADTDYTAVTTARSVTIPAGQSSASVEVETLEDTVDEPAETFLVVLSSPTNAELGSYAGRATIADDDATPTTATLTVSPASVREGVSNASLTVTVTLDGSTTFSENKTVRVQVGKAGDEAVSGSDYAAVDEFNIKIPARASRGQDTFSFSPTEDGLDEDDETLTVYGAGTGLTISDATLTITDHSPTVLPDATVRFGRAFYTLHEDGPSQDIEVTLSRSLTTEVVVRYRMESKTAVITAGGDMRVATGKNLVFAPGDTRRIIKVHPVDNNIVEPDEWVRFSLEVVSGNVGVGTFTIVNLTDDDLSSVQVSHRRSKAEEGEQQQIRVRMSKPHQNDVTLDGVVGGTAISGEDYVAIPHQLLIPAGGTEVTVTFDLLEDNLQEGTETIELVVANPSEEGVSVLPGHSTHTVIIVNKQPSGQPPPTPSSDSGLSSESEPSNGLFDALIAKMYKWRNDPQWVAYQAHTDRWDRALLAFGETVADMTLPPMTAGEAQAFADRGWNRWVVVAAALAEIEAGDGG